MPRRLLSILKPFFVVAILLSPGLGSAAQAGSGSVKTAPRTPNVFQISLKTSEYVETNLHSEHFIPIAMKTESDGHGGWITAVVGQRFPTADGYGQIVFFWHNTTFVGTDATTEHTQVALTGGGPGYFRVTYATYKAGAPACCPTGKAAVRFRFNGAKFAPGRPLPKGNGIQVEDLY